MSVSNASLQSFWEDVIHKIYGNLGYRSMSQEAPKLGTQALFDYTTNWSRKR